MAESPFALLEADHAPEGLTEYLPPAAMIVADEVTDHG